MLVYSYAKTVEWKWHLVSILLHAITAGLVYQTLLLSLRNIQCQNSPLLALIAAIVFAVHPAQSESVAWVATAANSLTAIPILLSLMAYLKARDGSLGWLLGSAALYSLALFTKEFAVILPLLLLAYELFLLDKLPSLKAWLLRSALYSLPFIIITLSFFLIRYRVLGVLTIGKVPLNSNFPEVDIISRAVQLYTLPSIILSYLQNILLPFSLKPFYPVSHIHSPELFNFYLPAATVLLLLAFCVVAARRYAPMRLELIWFLVPLMPVLELRAFKPECLMFDRYLYLSLAGAGLLLGQAILWLNLRLAQQASKPGTHLRASLVVSLSLIYPVMIATTIKQNQVWTDEWSYWSAAHQSFPDSCFINKEMGRLNQQSLLFTQAIYHYEKAKKACPKSADVMFQLGTLYIATGNLEQAEAESRRLLEVAISPEGAAKGFFNLGLVYQKKGDRPQAIEFYQKAVQLNSHPFSTEARYQLGVLYASANQLEQAEAEFNYLVQTAPHPTTTAASYFNLGLIFQKRGQHLEAVEFYRKAIAIDPTSDVAIKAKEKLSSL